MNQLLILMETTFKIQEIRVREFIIIIMFQQYQLVIIAKTSQKGTNTHHK
jgi:hypothetical protein